MVQARDVRASSPGPENAYRLRMQVSVLGPVEVEVGGAQVDLGTPKQRALVALLALWRGTPVPVDTLVETLWPRGVPSGAAGTLQAHVSRLRRVLEPSRGPRERPSVLVTAEPGYALRVAGTALDAAAFEATVSGVHRRLAPGRPPWAPIGVPRPLAEELLHGLDEALTSWRGMPYVELGEMPAAVAERARLEELRLVALEDRAGLLLALGEHATAAADLEALTQQHPLREKIWALRVVALARARRQGDALHTLRQVRRLLDAELGIDPGPELEELLGLVLRRADELSAPPVDRPDPQPPSPARPGAGVRAPRPDGATPAADTDVAPWPLLDRDDDLTALSGALDRAMRGTPALAALVGEPGIGKSRLAAEIAHLARGRGVLVVSARCSQDEGAPPLRPWRGVLAGLGRDLPTPGGDDEGAAFRLREGIVDAVLGAAQERAVLLVLDDLHWADTETLRVLRLLVESAAGQRLMVVGTWRSHPVPEGALAEVAESFARGHAVRREPRPLAASAIGRLVEAVAAVRPSQDEAEALARRTDGNPFYVVEYARLVREHGEVGEVVAGTGRPEAVSDVLRQRVARLPEDTQATLAWAAVVGREFDGAVLAAVTDTDEDTLLDRIDPAVAAGLVSERGSQGYAFDHALVRDTLYEAGRAGVRARRHAQVATVLEAVGGRETEVARHWLLAGPSRAPRAWRAARQGAAAMRAVHAHSEAADLLAAALAAMGQDPAATPAERHALLMELAEAQRWAGDWASLVVTTGEAIEVAERTGDATVLAQTAAATSEGALWQSAPLGEANTRVVGALRQALGSLPPADGAARCRAMLALAHETYYVSTLADRLDLVEDGLAMARRLGDEDLLVDGLQLAAGAVFSPSTAPRRREWMLEAARLTTGPGRERAALGVETLHAVAAGELGLVGEMRELTARARARAREMRIHYGLTVLSGLELPWAAMRGDLDRAEELYAEVASTSALIRVPQGAEAVAGSLLPLRIWAGRADEVVDDLVRLASATAIPIASAVAVVMLRAGQEQRAREWLASHPIDLGGEDWYSLLNRGYAAEVAAWSGDPVLAAAAYAGLAPYAGWSCSAGSVNACGPVDAFLALAASATGDRDVAGRHAERALALVEDWEIPLVGQWLLDQRDRWGF